MTRHRVPLIVAEYAAERFAQPERRQSRDHGYREAISDALAIVAKETHAPEFHVIGLRIVAGLLEHARTVRIPCRICKKPGCEGQCLFPNLNSRRESCGRGEPVGSACPTGSQLDDFVRDLEDA
jgi:hypothetical protein